MVQRQWLAVGWSSFGVAAVVLALRGLGALQGLELTAYDLLLRSRPPESQDPRVVVVGIEESDLDRAGEWPLSDQRLADLIVAIANQAPRAIGLDLYRNLPVPPGTAAFEAVQQSTAELIGIQKVVGDRLGGVIPPPPMLAELEQVGVNDVVEDADGQLRRGIFFITTDDGITHLSLSLRLSLMYLAAEGINPAPAARNPDWLQLGQGKFPIFEPSDGGYVRADAAGYQVLLNYRGGRNHFQIVSLFDVLDSTIAPDLFRDAVVLIGPTAESLNDYFLTPYSGGVLGTPERTSGVEIHANMVSQILAAALDGRPLVQVWPEWAEVVWLLLWSIASAAVCWGLKLRPLTLLLLAGGVVVLVGSSVVALNVAALWLPLAAPLVAYAGVAIAITALIANQEQTDRKIVMNLFGRHVTAEVAEAIWRDREQLLSDGRLKGRRTMATVLFTDLKDFSTITERTDAELLMRWLNEYMEVMAQQVLEHQGIVDKFIGDAVMAVFGVPIPRSTEAEIARDAQQAVRCALAMGETLAVLNTDWQARGLPKATMRVGIATGDVVVGSLGSSKRIDYTTIGDSVNVAARLESYDKALDGGTCRILISARTYDYCQAMFASEGIVSEVVGEVRLKGRQQPVLVYQIRRVTPITASPTVASPLLSP